MNVSNNLDRFFLEKFYISNRSNGVWNFFLSTGKNEDDDSKALTEEKRDDLLLKLQDNSNYIGYAIHVLSPRYISFSMYRRSKYNLNTMSHDTAIDLVKLALEKGVQVAEIYVDTVGPPEKYQAKLQEIFPAQKVTVAKKADSLYPCVSAASICAKVCQNQNQTKKLK